MRVFSPRLLCILGLLAIGPSTALAHIDLLSPTPRYTRQESGDNKACPCGLGESNRLCNIPEDRNDPDRASAERITVLQKGSTVTLRFSEYVGHAGRYRVAIDFDGADLADFNENILLDVPDPSGGDGNIGEGNIWELEVTLPDVTCTNCTLQLVQMMDGNTNDPVPDPAGRSSYYTCADIQLVEGEVPDGGVPPIDAGSSGVDGGLAPQPAEGGCSSSGPSKSSAILAIGFALAFLRRRNA